MTKILVAEDDRDIRELLLFSLRNLNAVDTGFDDRGVTVLTIANGYRWTFGAHG